MSVNDLHYTEFERKMRKAMRERDNRSIRFKVQGSSGDFFNERGLRRQTVDAFKTCVAFLFEAAYLHLNLEP